MSNTTYTLWSIFAYPLLALILLIGPSLVFVVSLGFNRIKESQNRRAGAIVLLTLASIVLTTKMVPVWVNLDDLSLDYTQSHLDDEKQLPFFIEHSADQLGNYILAFILSIFSHILIVGTAILCAGDEKLETRFTSLLMMNKTASRLPE